MKRPSENQPQEVLAGFVERVTYHNIENGFCVFRAKARGLAAWQEIFELDVPSG